MLRSVVLFLNSSYVINTSIAISALQPAYMGAANCRTLIQAEIIFIYYQVCGEVVVISNNIYGAAALSIDPYQNAFVFF